MLTREDKKVTEFCCERCYSKIITSEDLKEMLEKLPNGIGAFEDNIDFLYAKHCDFCNDILGEPEEEEHTCERCSCGHKLEEDENDRGIAQLIQIDSNIADLVRKLNRRGYETELSCGGHFDFFDSKFANGKYVASVTSCPYIVFTAWWPDSVYINEILPNVPEGLTLSQVEKVTPYPFDFRCKYYLGIDIEVAIKDVYFNTDEEKEKITGKDLEIVDLDAAFKKFVDYICEELP